MVNLSAIELSEKIKNKELTSEEITTQFINRIKSIDSEIGAFTELKEEEALKEAKESDLDKSSLLLKGVPVAIKAIISNKGFSTNASSKILKDYKALYDSTVVKKIKEHKMPILGTLNMDEFAMGSSNETSHYGKVKNPWNKEYVPGGSSGGSSAAVASLEAPITLGTDTGGSIRQPASFTGTVGLKPTYGRVSRYGIIAFASSLDQVGIIAKTSKDVAAMLEVIAGYDEKDSTSANLEVPEYTKLLDRNLQGLKIGIPKEYFGEGLDKEVKDSIEKTINDLKSMGCIIEEVSLPTVEYSISTYYVISSAEAASNLSRYDGVRYGYRGSDDDVESMYYETRTEGFGDEVKRRIMIGNYVLSSGFYDAYYKKASKIRRLIKNEFDSVFEKVDVILTPSTPTTAFKIGEKVSDPLSMYLNDIYTVSVNLAGLPAISIPSGFSKENMPIGVQLIGKPFDEATLLKIGDAYEEKRGKLEYPKL